MHWSMCAFVCAGDSLRRGEWTTGSEWAGLLCADSSPRNLWEWLVAEELWGTGRHAEQPPTDAPPHDTHTSDALNRITRGTRHDHTHTTRRTTTTTTTTTTSTVSQNELIHILLNNTAFQSVHSHIYFSVRMFEFITQMSNISEIAGIYGNTFLVSSNQTPGLD